MALLIPLIEEEIESRQPEARQRPQLRDVTNMRVEGVEAQKRPTLAEFEVSKNDDMLEKLCPVELTIDTEIASDDAEEAAATTIPMARSPVPLRPNAMQLPSPVGMQTPRGPARVCLKNTFIELQPYEEKRMAHLVCTEPKRLPSQGQPDRSPVAVRPFLLEKLEEVAEKSPEDQVATEADSSMLRTPGFSSAGQAGPERSSTPEPEYRYEMTPAKLTLAKLLPEGQKKPTKVLKLEDELNKLGQRGGNRSTPIAQRGMQFTPMVQWTPTVQWTPVVHWTPTPVKLAELLGVDASSPVR